MALKQLLLAKERDDLKAKLEEFRSQDFTARRTALDGRRTELEARINALTSDDEQLRTQIEADVTQLDADYAALEAEEATRSEMIDKTERAISDLDAAIAEMKARTDGIHTTNTSTERTNKDMKNRFFSTREQADVFFQREDVSSFLTEFRTKLRTMSGASLTIPDVFLGVVRENISEYSRLITKVRRFTASGTTRMNITGSVPEAIWTEATGNINELDFSVTQITADGYMVAGFIAIPNSVLDDSSQPKLGEFILSQLAESIGKAIDLAILYGSGSNMPIGIATRLAASSQPAWWGANQAAFTDLHSTHVLTLNIASESGAAFFAALANALAVADPKYSDKQLCWIMNRKTHLAIRAKALAFGVPELVSAGTSTLPVVGGEVIELNIPDNNIIGGYFDNYLLVERESASVEQSREYRFLENQTVFKAQARYDGKPFYGEAFVLASLNNSAPSTSRTFPTDWANTELGQLSVTAAASASNVGKTVLTVTGTEASGTTLKYKKGSYKLHAGDTLGTGWTTLESGTTEITAAAGTTITVAEIDGSGHVIKVDAVEAVPKAS